MRIFSCSDNTETFDVLCHDQVPWFYANLQNTIVFHGQKDITELQKRIVFPFSFSYFTSSFISFNLTKFVTSNKSCYSNKLQHLFIIQYKLSQKNNFQTNFKDHNQSMFGWKSVLSKNFNINICLQYNTSFHKRMIPKQNSRTTIKELIFGWKSVFSFHQFFTSFFQNNANVSLFNFYHPSKLVQANKLTKVEKT